MIDRLQRLDTSAVSDAMDQLGLTNGFATGLRGVSVLRRIAGRCVTVTLEEARGRRSTEHLGTRAIEHASPGDVIVVANRDAQHVSGWGGLLSLGASLRGVNGVIVDGACRDADEMVDLDFPAYARGTTPRTARGRIIETAWNEPVSIADIAVAPGDYVIADRTGVVFVPADCAERVVGAAEAIFARESAMADAIRSGATIREALASYERLLIDGR